MSQRSKLYTRTGDNGTTGLLGPVRVSKADARIEAYGTVDELNATLGLALALDRERLEPYVPTIQEQLFCVGAMLASVGDAEPVCVVDTEDVAQLERWIDQMDQELEPLCAFILPGGAPAAAALHVARTVCRRAERRVVALAASEPVPRVIVQYLNRLSDLLFVLARWLNRSAAVPDRQWLPRKNG